VDHRTLVGPHAGYCGALAADDFGPAYGVTGWTLNSGKWTKWVETTDATSMRARHGVLLAMVLASNLSSPNRRKGRFLCGAKTRAGGCCQVRAEPGKARCRFHGGKSTGPKTQAGRARIAEAQRLRWLAYRERVGRSEVATKPDLKGNYLLVRTHLVTS
jgi:hypothetical protein